MLLLLLACAHRPTPPETAPVASTAAPTGAATTAGAAASNATPLPALDPESARVIGLIRADDRAWTRLADLCDSVGARPAGSAALEDAVRWSTRQFEADGLANVRAEPVKVPVWIRGAESIRMTAPHTESLTMLGLGGSVGTPGIEAAVVVVRSFEELGPQVAGKIVLFNHPMEAGTPSISHYGPAVAYRSSGASKAASFGAVAALVRSVTTRSLDTAHTGAMRYAEGVAKIPTAAVTTEDADRIARMTAAGQEVRLALTMGARVAPDATSHNVLAELRGSTDEVVVIGAHLDSWDVGQGAQDDGAGVVHVIEAMRHLRALGVVPRRTIRAVLFTNEEFGLSGGLAYDAAHGTEKHVAAIESDLGGGAPIGWSATGSPADSAWLTRALAPSGLPLTREGGGADISPLQERGVLVIGLLPDDSHYFDIHHTRADTVDKVDPIALRGGVEAVATLAWRLANLDR